jgi:phage tail sheath protein FI
MPGRSSVPASTACMQHALDNNRCAVLEAPDSGDLPTLQALAAALRGQPGDRFSALFSPWADIAGIASATTRPVGWAGIQAGLIARADAAGGPNVASAGMSDGQSRTALDLRDAFSDQQRNTLMTAGVNTAREVYGAIEGYGFRTLVDPVADANWRGFNNSRLIMQITARAEAIAERYVFAGIDGRGHLLAAFQGDLSGMLLDYWPDGGLYGDTPADAFQVEVGPSVNPPDQLADGVIKAVISLRCSPFAEYVVVEIVKVPAQEALA